MVKDEAKWILSGGAMNTKHSSMTNKTLSSFQQSLDRKNTTTTDVDSPATTTLPLLPPPHWIYKVHFNGGGSIIYAPKL
eukprot:4423721-Ditylum_brightwellii.AAC.1